MLSSISTMKIHHAMLLLALLCVSVALGHHHGHDDNHEDEDEHGPEDDLMSHLEPLFYIMHDMMEKPCFSEEAKLVHCVGLDTEIGSKLNDSMHACGINNSEGWDAMMQDTNWEEALLMQQCFLTTLGWISDNMEIQREQIQADLADLTNLAGELEGAEEACYEAMQVVEVDWLQDWLSGDMCMEELEETLMEVMEVGGLSEGEETGPMNKKKKKKKKKN